MSGGGWEIGIKREDWRWYRSRITALPSKIGRSLMDPTRHHRAMICVSGRQVFNDDWLMTIVNAFSARQRLDEMKRVSNCESVYVYMCSGEYGHCLVCVHRSSPSGRQGDLMNNTCAIEFLDPRTMLALRFEMYCTCRCVIPPFQTRQLSLAVRRRSRKQTSRQSQQYTFAVLFSSTISFLCIQLISSFPSLLY